MALVAGAVLATMAIAGAWKSRLDLAELEKVLRQAQESAALAAAVPIATRPPRPYTDGLPQRATAEPLLAAVGTLGKAHAVTLVQADVAEQPPTAAALGTVNVALTLAGSYAGIKALLAGLLEAAPNGVLMQLDLRSSPAAPGALDATVKISLLGQPGGASAGPR